MDFGRFHEELEEAIGKIDSEKTHDFISKNLEVLNQPESCDVRRLLLSNSRICKNEKIIALLVNSFDIDIHDRRNLEKFLKLAVWNGKVKLAELLLKNGIKFFSSKNWYKRYLARRNVKNRREMLELLIQHGSLNLNQ